MGTKKTEQRNEQKKIWLLKKINKIDKCLTKLTKRKRENIQINKIRGQIWWLMPISKLLRKWRIGR
jgi:hypothetical protein